MSSIRTEALLNEYKGNLYEFLVASSMAKKFKIELDFLNSLTPDFQKMLSQQEQFIREYYPYLLNDLPLLSLGLTEHIVDELVINKILKVQIVGKAAMAANDERFQEGDVLLYDDNKIIPVSIKICKANSFVNTKSAGLKSFFSKYFNENEAQIVLNSKVDKILDQQLYDLYELAGLDIDTSFDNWINADLPTLPGALEESYRQIYLNSLYEINKIIYETFKQIVEKKSVSTLSAISSLIGFGSIDIIQATTFYRNTGDKYELYEQVVETSEKDKYNFENIKLSQFKDNKTSFDIILPDRTLQIRVKAMNKFTSKSYKINCSVKKN